MTKELSISQTLSFFRSVILSGESWSSTCEAAFDSAQTRLTGNAQGRSGSVVTDLGECLDLIDDWDRHGSIDHSLAYELHTKLKKIWNSLALPSTHDEAANLYAWPIGCHSPNSCRRNGRCMYINCEHAGTASMVSPAHQGGET
jgi:hypothetical protein